jgi:hypothetical protein
LQHLTYPNPSLVNTPNSPLPHSFTKGTALPRTRFASLNDTNQGLECLLILDLNVSSTLTANKLAFEWYYLGTLKSLHTSQLGSSPEDCSDACSTGNVFVRQRLHAYSATTQFTKSFSFPSVSELYPKGISEENTSVIHWQQTRPSINPATAINFKPTPKFEYKKNAFQDHAIIGHDGPRSVIRGS